MWKWRTRALIEVVDAKVEIRLHKQVSSSGKEVGVPQAIIIIIHNHSVSPEKPRAVADALGGQSRRFQRLQRIVWHAVGKLALKDTEPTERRDAAQSSSSSPWDKSM